MGSVTVNRIGSGKRDAKERKKGGPIRTTQDGAEYQISL